jgi:hypothetical protein
MMSVPPLSGEFRPDLIPRRGEIVAWALALFVLLVWVGFTAAGQACPLSLQILAGVLILAGLAISLSNWVDRQTVLSLGEEGVAFRNGLRRVNLCWGEIQQVQVYPSSWGDKVYVMGKGTYFAFRTQREVLLKGQVRGRMGFAAGEALQSAIVERAGLHRTSRQGEGIYYGRD